MEIGTRTRLYVEHLGFFLMEQESLVNKKRKAVLPVLRERQQLVDSLSRILGQLGLERRAKRVPSLPEYIADKYKDSGSVEQERSYAKTKRRTCPRSNAAARLISDISSRSS